MCDSVVSYIRFCRDVRMLIFGAEHKVVLHRKSEDNDVIWRAAGVEACKVILSKLLLWMPVLSPSIPEEQRLLSFMDTGCKSLLSWGTTTTHDIQGDLAGLFTWHMSLQQGVTAPRHIFIAFQDHLRLNNQERNPTLSVSEVSLRINGHQE